MHFYQSFRGGVGHEIPLKSLYLHACVALSKAAKWLTHWARTWATLWRDKGQNKLGINILVWCTKWMRWQDWLWLARELEVLWARLFVLCLQPCPSVCLPEQPWKWFDWLPRASSFLPPFALLLNRRKKSCLHPPCPALWGLLVSLSFRAPAAASQPREVPSAAPLQNRELSLPPPPLSASSGPPHLLSWRVGLCRRSPLSLSFFFFLALMELYLRQRGNIFHLFLFSPPATAPPLTISFFFFH